MLTKSKVIDRILNLIEIYNIYDIYDIIQDRNLVLYEPSSEHFNFFASGSSASLAEPSDASHNSVHLRSNTTTLQVSQIILLVWNLLTCFLKSLSQWNLFICFLKPSKRSLETSFSKSVSSGLKRTVFSSVASLTSVQLEGNPLHCDCRLEWLAVWLSSKVCPSLTTVPILHGLLPPQLIWGWVAAGKTKHEMGYVLGS